MNRSFEFKEKFLEIEERLQTAEEEIRILREAHVTVGGMAEEAKERLENQRLMRRMLLDEASRQSDAMRAVASRADEILHSQMWKNAGVARRPGLASSFR